MAQTRSPFALPAVLLCLVLIPSLLPAQTPSPDSPPAQVPDQPPTPAGDAPYTLRTQTRIVLLDVNVTDAAGNPVHSLPRSAFHVTDDKQAETVSYFDEHSLTGADTSVAPTSHPRGTYSNDFLLHAPPVLNVLLLDISNLETEDQIILRIQLTHLIDALPGNQPLAVYLRTTGASILLQDFTTDRALLHAAVNHALPRLFVNNIYLDDLYTLHQITSTLQQLPGRKNLLWFSGGAPLSAIGSIQGDPTLYRDNVAVRAVYDELEAARIAVYPIDARGLTVTGGLAQQIQHAAMDDVAHATGGHAVYNNNGIAESTARTLETDRSFYTLTYTPDHFKPDHKWHNVHVSLDDPHLHLSYRAGYFSDGQPPVDVPELRASTRSHVLADGSVEKGPETPTAPIVFNAQVLPATDPASRNPGGATVLTPVAVSHHGSVPYSIQYSVPADSFSVKSIDGKPSLVLGVVAIAFSGNGTALAHTAQQVTFSVKADRLPLSASVRVPLIQQLALNKGDVSLFLAVWDGATGRVGTLEIPLHVTAPAKP